MATWDSADCLSRLIDELRLPVDDSGTLVTQETSTTKLYRLLSDAQRDVYQDLVPRIPHVFIGAPRLLTSSDNGKTFTISDGTQTIYATGHMRVYIRLEDVPWFPLVEGADYVIEGDLLRYPANLTWPFGTGPYVQNIAEPLDISASQDPVLPVAMRRAMIYRAAERFCKQGGLKDPAYFTDEYQTAIRELCLQFQTAVFTQGAQTMGNAVSAWRLARWGRR